MADITNSVGNGGKNVDADVQEVQTLLNGVIRRHRRVSWAVFVNIESTAAVNNVKRLVQDHGGSAFWPKAIASPFQAWSATGRSDVEQGTPIHVGAIERHDVAWRISFSAEVGVHLFAANRSKRNRGSGQHP